MIIIRHESTLKMTGVKEEIRNAITTLKLSEDDITLLDSTSGQHVYYDCLHHFVNSGDRRWWWEDFNQPFFSFKTTDKPFELLNDLIPETASKVWLIVEDSKEPFYPVYDAKPAIIKDIIGACFGFEYYIIAKNKEWLLCENHHGILIGIGNELRAKNIDRITL